MQIRGMTGTVDKRKQKFVISIENIDFKQSSDERHLQKIKRI